MNPAQAAADANEAEWKKYWSAVALYLQDSCELHSRMVPLATRHQRDQTYLQTLHPSSIRPLNAGPLHEFVPRYSLPDFKRFLHRAYREYWTFFTTGRVFMGKHTQFYEQMKRSFGPSRRWDQPLLDKEFEWTVEPLEFARVVVYYLRSRADQAGAKHLWFHRHRPRYFPECHVEKILLPKPKSGKIRIMNIGDLHGSVGVVINFLLSLANDILVDDQWSLLDPDTYIVFTGDFADRGYFGVEIWLIVMYLVIKNPTQVFVIKANHEYGAESDFRRVEAIDKLHVPNDIYPHIFQRVAESFPDMLFVMHPENDKYKCWIYSHGAVEIGYNPQGFLLHPDSRFHLLPEFNRRPYFNYLSQHFTEFFKKIIGCEQFKEVLMVERSSPERSNTSCGPIWNYHYNGSGVHLGPVGNGLFINRQALCCLFDFWNQVEYETHFAAGYLSKVWGYFLSSQEPRPTRIPESSHMIDFRTCIGGHEHSDIKDVNFLAQAQRQNGVGCLWLSPRYQGKTQKADAAKMQNPESLSTESQTSPNLSSVSSPKHDSEESQRDPESEAKIAPMSSTQEVLTKDVQALHQKRVSTFVPIRLDEPIDPDSDETCGVQYLVYKFFNMQDLVYYQIKTVSHGLLSITQKEDRIVDKMEACIIPDVGKFYSERGKMQALFEESIRELSGEIRE